MDKLDKNFKAFFTHCENILNANEQLNQYSIGRPNIFRRNLNSYMTKYSKTQPNEHIPDVLFIYNKSKDKILKPIEDPVDDLWIRTGSIVLQYGTGIIDPKKPSKISISALYNTSVKVRDEAEKALQNMPDEEKMNHSELIYPEIYLLHLYRILRECVETPDEKEKLAANVILLEKLLGTIHDSEVKSDITTPITGIMGAVTPLMNAMGAPPPSGAKMPTDGDINRLISGFTNNQQIINSMKKIGSSVNMGPNSNPMEAIPKLLQELGNQPELFQAIGDTLKGTSVAASFNAMAPPTPITPTPPPPANTNANTNDDPAMQN